MPYRILVCNICDMHVMSGEPHGPEDEYCEGEDGYDRIYVYTEHEIARRQPTLRCVLCMNQCTTEDMPGEIRQIVRCPVHGDILGVEGVKLSFTENRDAPPDGTIQPPNTTEPAQEGTG